MEFGHLFTIIIVLELLFLFNVHNIGYSTIDTMDEIYENREQIEVVRHYEQMPKPTLMATQEYLDGDIYYRNPAKEDKNMQRLEAMENEAIAEGVTAETK